MSAKRIGWSTLIILSLLLATFFAVDFYHYSKDTSPYRTFFIPRIEIGELEINSLTLDKIDLHGKVLIHNPLPFNLKIDSLTYTIIMYNVEVLKSSYKKSFFINRWDSTWIKIPANVYLYKLVSIIDRADKRKKDSVVYELQTTFYSHIPFKQNFNITIIKKLPLFYLPSLQIVKVDYDSLSLKGVTLLLQVVIDNKNKFPIHYKNLTYRFALAENSWIHGKKSGIMDIKKEAITPFTLPMRISFTSMYKSLGKLIKNGDRVTYRFRLDVTLMSEKGGMRDTKVYINDSGTLNKIIKLAKDVKKRSKKPS